MSELTGKAIVFTGPGKPFSIRDYPVLDPKPQDVVLDLEYSGICGTDVHIHHGRLGMPPGDLIIGHEFIGRIRKPGKDVKNDGLGTPLAAGDHAIACVAIPCGTCFNCSRGETASCLRFGVTYCKNPGEAPHFFGGFAEYLHSPAKNLVRIPEGVKLASAAAFPCAGPTLIRAITYGGGLEPKELVVVQGSGPLGLFAVAWATAAGCQVVMIGSGTNPDRRKLAEELGIIEFLDFRKTTPESRRERILALAADQNRGDGADVVIETSGAPDAFPEGLSLVRTRGRYLVPGQYSSSGPVSINPEQITFRALRIIGSGQYTMKDIGTYLDFLRQHPRIQEIFGRCISHRFQLEDAEKAFACAAKGEVIKAVFTRRNSA